MTQPQTVLALSAFCLFFLVSSVHAQNGNWKIQPVSIQTRWAKEVRPDNVLQEYPRPQMVRSNWQNLNGLWQYTITEKDAVMPSRYDKKVLVPYPLESALSGVQKALLPNERLWYKTSFHKPNLKDGNRALLHFGAVDWQATIYVNNKEIGSHIGGYQNFFFDITEALKEGDNDLVVSVWDPTDQGPNPHGKQVLNPQGIMYTSSSGIWQTVWLETVPPVSIASLYMTPDIDRGNLQIYVNTSINVKDYTIEAITSTGSSIKGKIGDTLSLPVPNARLWSPDDPYLYHLNVRLLYKGKIIDTVGSYFGMRKISIGKDAEGIERIFLNNKYTFQMGVLDQGFWPEGLYTAPTDEALSFDILAIKNMGFNTIRKHIKIEPSRWYYHADRLGVLVWQDMVNPGNDSPEGRAEFEAENKEVLTQLHNYPSIVTWVVFNEGWGAYDQARITQLVKKQDPSRLINGHSGENYYRASPNEISMKWANSDMTDEHIYPGPGIPPALPQKVRVLGEWGGIGVSIAEHTWRRDGGWGYIKILPSSFARKYELMVKHLKVYEEEGLSAAIYTEPFDVELEENGLMTYDRSVIKIAPEKLRKMHSIILPQAKDYTSTLGAFAAEVADTTNPYHKKLKQYTDGNRNPILLRELATLALSQGDTVTANNICKVYTMVQKNSLVEADIIFLSTFMKTTQDPAFLYAIKNASAIETVPEVGGRLMSVVRAIISQQISSPMIFDTLHGVPDFEKIQKQLTNVYGNVGELAVLQDVAFYYYGKKDLKRFVDIKNQIRKKYPDAIDNWTGNNDAWFVFENATINDSDMLQSALSWSYKIVQEEPRNAGSIDTYANLLYKLGRKADARVWQEKAVKEAPNNRAIAENHEKMQRGEPTWE